MTNIPTHFNSHLSFPTLSNLPIDTPTDSSIKTPRSEPLIEHLPPSPPPRKIRSGIPGFKELSQGSILTSNAVANKKNSEPAKKPILITLIFHKDVTTAQREAFLEDGFALAKGHIGAISGREVHYSIASQSNLRDFNYNYEGEVKVLTALDEHIERNTPRNAKSSYAPQLTKYLFVTPTHTSNHPGLAITKDNVGITSAENTRGAAHALGHMFGATHNDGEVTYNGWWNDTIMQYNYESVLRGNDLRFSEKNQKNIRNHLDKFP